MLLAWLATRGRCAALCGNCRDDYWDRDRYRAGDVVTTDVVFKPVLPTYIPLIFRLLTV